MSEQSSQEPTMEEILASIRRIISEDEAPAGEGSGDQAEELAAAARASMADLGSEEASARAPMASELEPEPAAEEDDALELTEKVETHGDLDIVPTAPAAPPPPPLETEPLVSDPVASVAAAAFGQLSSAMLMPEAGRTLEDVVRELLRPMLQQWLDDNLPGIVQQAVTAEVERIARGRVR